MIAEKSAEAIVAAQRWRRVGQGAVRTDSMDVIRQQEQVFQRSLFEGEPQTPRHGATGKGETGPGAFEAPPASTAWERCRALTQNLMEEVADPANLSQALKKVVANKGAPGADGMTTDKLGGWLDANREWLRQLLLRGDYRPSPVRKVEIPKPSGGTRQLGIPTVVDRLVQQAILQILTPVLDPLFSGSSFGFRPGRSAHDALRQASEYVADGRYIVVDLDIEEFFDRVNHDMLMARLARHVGDKRLLKTVRGFLSAGIMDGGVCVSRYEGTPQGGPLSPLLANLMLDDLDKELERRGHRFCRYADDVNIYVRSEAAGERVMASITRFIEKRLGLKVSARKSAVAPSNKRAFLGHRILEDGRLVIAPRSLRRAKDRIRRITRRNRGISFERMIRELNRFLTGWVAYFRHAQAKSNLRSLDGWLRRKLRCMRLKQRKRPKAIADFLRNLGVPEWRAWLLACSGKGWWRMAGSPQANEAMTVAWFKEQGLVNLSVRYEALKAKGNRRGTEYVCPVV